jgi:hypothetical protein
MQAEDRDMLEIKIQKKAGEEGPGGLAMGRYEETASKLQSRALNGREQQAVLLQLPPWIQEQRVTGILALMVQMRVGTDLDDFSQFVMENAPPSIPLRLCNRKYLEINPEFLMAIALFPSGAVRTVGSVQSATDDCIALVPFDYWSLIDPDDTTLEFNPDTDLCLEMKMLAVATEL